MDLDKPNSIGLTSEQESRVGAQEHGDTTSVGLTNDEDSGSTAQARGHFHLGMIFHNHGVEFEKARWTQAQYCVENGEVSKRWEGLEGVVDSGAIEAPPGERLLAKTS